MTAIRFAERMSRLGTESAFEVLAKARRLEADGKRIVHLEIGEPDFATPDNIVEAGISAIQNGYTHYTPASGILEARQAVAGFVTRMLKVDPGGRSTETFVHDFWEEVYIVEGSQWDGDQFFKKGMYACRPPGMKHGPYRTDDGVTTLEVRYMR